MNVKNPYSVKSFGLRAVYLRESACKLHEKFNPLIPGLPLIGEFKIHHNKSIAITKATGVTAEGNTVEITTCAYTTRFEFRYNVGAQEQFVGNHELKSGETAAEICIEMVTDFALNGDDIPDDDIIRKFGESTALLVAWPYWREYCHSALAKMSLPIAVIPLMTLTATSQTLVEEEVRKKEPAPKKATAAKSSKKIKETNR